MPKSPPSIAATSTLAMVRAATASGAAVEDLLEAAGVTREYLEDPDARLPGPTVLAIWSSLRERAADPLLQLSAPTTLPFGAYRVIDYLVAASATVGEGVRRFASFFGLIADAVSLDIESHENEHHLCLAMTDGGAVPPVYVDYVFAALVGRIRMRIKTDLQVKRVELRQPEPVASAPYRELFRAPVQFGAVADRLAFSSEEWDSPTESGDAALALLLEEHARILAKRVPQAASDFGAEVQKTIASAVATGGSAADVAQAMHISVRTLQRRLISVGTTFRELSDEVRSRLAEEYMSDRNVSIAEVAFLLGFSDQSSFHRAFRRWTGMSPGEWRRTSRAKLPA